MVTVKAKTINGTIEVFTTESYVIRSVKEMHPDLLDVRVYAGSRLVVHRHRFFQWFYKKYLYKPVQVELKPEDAEPAKK